MRPLSIAVLGTACASRRARIEARLTSTLSPWCPITRPRGLRGLPAVEFEQSACALSISDLTIVVRRLWAVENELIGKGLMISLAMIVSGVLGDDVSQMVFAKQDELVETLATYGAYEPFCECVQVRAAWG